MVSNKELGIKTLTIDISLKDYEWVKILKDEKDQSWLNFLLDLAEFKIKNSE